MHTTKKLSTYLAQGLVFLPLSLLIVSCGSTGGANVSKITVQVLDGGGELQLVKSILLN